MTIEEKLQLITNTLDTAQETLRPDTILANLEEWDSMGIISIIAMLDRKFNKVLDADQISSLKSVQEILNFME